MVAKNLQMENRKHFPRLQLHHSKLMIDLNLFVYEINMNLRICVSAVGITGDQLKALEIYLIDSHDNSITSKLCKD